MLVGFHTGDDAAVYRLDGNTALVQTVDVITPVVDDPYIYGQVAAANALSDIYAMGARPLMALSVVGLPPDRLSQSDMVLILKGGIDKAKEAGIDIVGGHSFDDTEPKFGLCVTGVVHPERVYRNASAKPGDSLILTKPLGVGVLTTAIKKGRLGEKETNQLVDVMLKLNRAACEAMIEAGASACTDITGFGLLNHLLGMLRESGVAGRIRISEVPVMKGVRELIREGAYPGGTRKNLDFASPKVDWAEGIEEVDRLVLADAQTSGGLLISVAADRVKVLKEALEKQGVSTRAEIGEIIQGGKSGRLEVIP